MPRVGPFLNWSQADTKRPKTVMGTVPNTMPNIKASIVADMLSEEPMSTSMVSMSIALAIWGNAPTTPAVTGSTPRRAADDWRGAATKAFWRATKATRQRATAGRRERIAIAKKGKGQIVLQFCFKSWALRLEQKKWWSSNDAKTPYSGSDVKIVPMCCSTSRANGGRSASAEEFNSIDILKSSNVSSCSGLMTRTWCPAKFELAGHAAIFRCMPSGGSNKLAWIRSKYLQDLLWPKPDMWGNKKSASKNLSTAVWHPNQNSKNLCGLAKDFHPFLHEQQLLEKAFVKP